MSAVAKIFLILTVMCVPAAVFLPGPWWGWLVLAACLFVAGAIADIDDDESDTSNSNRV